MMDRTVPLDGIDREIKDILYGYVKAESITYSPGEKDAARYFLEFFRAQPYWQTHPEDCGAAPIPGDPFDRAPVFAMVRGAGPDTVVLMHHYDVVSVEDFKLLKPLAFSPDKLEEELRKLSGTLAPEVQADLASGAYLYGRGVCDMKGGGSIQMALLRRYSELVLRDPAALPGNLMVLAVPDEENLSAGMRAAAPLLARLQEQYGLRYRLMINSEPHRRSDTEKGVFSLGSIGKLMPFVYVRGSLTHVSKIFEGFNPVNLMSEIVRRTELNMDFSDTVASEAAPPPTWLYLRDRKQEYDVSVPLSIAGCFSVLTMKQTPAVVLEKVRAICQDSFDAVLSRMNDSYARFCAAAGQSPAPLPWKPVVTDFSALYQEALAGHGDDFRTGYEAELDRLGQEMRTGGRTMLECNFALVDYVCNYVDDLSPRVVYGLIPPYYPSTANLFMEGLAPEIAGIQDILNEFTQREFGQTYTSEHFFTGISDLSYAAVSDGAGIVRALEDAMPFFGNLYDIPIAAIEQISMPCINIGPWGKDLHKMTERVLKEDLYHRTPRIIRHAIETVLGIG